jgi:hypothetical protein
MPLTPDRDLKDQILYNLSEYSDSGEVPHYDSDFIVGFAEAQLPVYYSEIIQEWQQLPMDYSNTDIFKLMTDDLYNYYSDKTAELLGQIRQETDNG